MNQTVIGIFENKTEAQHAVQDLMSEGITREKVDIAAESATGHRDTTTTAHTRDDRNDDSFSNFFSSLFGNNDEARSYSEVARRGWIVTVHADSRQEAERSAEVLDKNGAVDVDERARQYRAGGAAAAHHGSATTSTRSNDTDQSVPVIEEKVEIGKRVVETGGARLRSRIIEKPVEEKLRLRQEHLHIERNPVNRPATEADLANFKDGEINVTERAEIPMVNKEARVVEEIKLGKDVQEHEETVRENVRSTDVDIEKIRPEDDVDPDRTPRR